MSVGAARGALLKPLTAGDGIIWASADTYIQDGANENTNYGLGETMLTKGALVTGGDFARKMFIQFDLTDVSAINTIVMKLTYSGCVNCTSSKQIVGHGATVYDASPRGVNWVETGITWNNSLSSNNRNGNASTPYDVDWSNVQSLGSIDIVNNSTAGDIATLSGAAFTSYMQARIGGIASVLLRPATGDNSTTPIFYTKDNLSGKPGPFLEIT